MAAETSSSADSYIGSLIGLTSKSDIRYEGILYNINTEESSVGLRNVRTFGTEGRRKDGPQVLPSDKVYEYILFRGSDIKDLQVKSSPPVQPTPSLSSDPAIIQSHYSHPTSTATNLPATVSGSLTDASSHSAQLGHPLSAFQGGLPLYQPGGNLESWGPSPPPPNANGSGLALPTYWQGFYAPQNGLLQLHQQSLLRPSPGLSVPPSMQPPMQYPGFSASLPSGASSLPGSNLSEYSSFVPTATSSLGLTSTTSAASIIPPSLHPVPSTRLASDLLPSSMLSNTPNTEIPPRTPTSTLQSPSSLTSSIPDLGAVVAPSSNKNNAISAPALLYQTISQPISTAIGGPSSLIQTETPTPSLVTPGQLRQSGPFMVSSSNSSQIGNKDGGAVQVSPAPAPARAPKLPVSVPNEAQPPILPSPSPSHVTLKMDRAPFQTRQNYYRGRGRGRGAENSRPVAKFTEDFDFTAMNEKFNKDEVWGHLGKNSQLHSMEKEGDEEGSYEYDFQDENEAELPKFEAKPVYKKDDFFDSISCNALDNGPNNGRRFSEQMKLDTETFGYFSRVRGGHGGCSPSRGGRFRGSYYERGNGYGYGYMGRGRGRGWGV